MRKLFYICFGPPLAILIVVAASMASHDFLGQGLLESGAELVLAGAFALVATAPVWAVGIKFRKKILVYAGLVLAVAIVGLHLRASAELAPLKARFHAVASRGPVKIDWNVAEDDGGTYHAANFGGSLKDLVKKRDERLQAKGYTSLGGWMYRGGGARTAMMYIYVPWSGELSAPIVVVLAVLAAAGYFTLATLIAEWQYGGMGSGHRTQCGSPGGS